MKNYFSHDLHARHDRKLVKLFKAHKLAGIGAYWCIIEILHEENGYILRSEIENIAYELRVKSDFILKVLNDFELFSNDSQKFWSESALLRIAFKNEKSVKARESANNRWHKDANALLEENERNAIKLNNNKVNKIKEKEIKEDLPFAEFDNSEPDKKSEDWEEKKEPKPTKPKRKKAAQTDAPENENYNLIKDYFLSFYKKEFSEDYYFSGIDGAKIKALIKKIEFKVRDKNGGNDPTPEQLSEAAMYYISACYQTADEWLKSNFTLTTLDSQFNKLFLQIKNGKPANTQTRSNQRNNDNGLTPAQRAYQLYHN